MHVTALEARNRKGAEAKLQVEYRSKRCEALQVDRQEALLGAISHLAKSGGEAYACRVVMDSALATISDLFRHAGSRAMGCESG